MPLLSKIAADCWKHVANVKSEIRQLKGEVLLRREERGESHLKAVFSIPWIIFGETPSLEKEPPSSGKIAIWHAEAEKGHADSQYALGIVYFGGYGVRENKMEAVKWLEKAAEQGHSGAQYNLGIAYQSGGGVQWNRFEAMIWFGKAAVQGDANALKYLKEAAVLLDNEALFVLGGMYWDGEGVSKNRREAVNLFRKAAEQGFACAQFNLAIACLTGEGETINMVEAVKWFHKSATQYYADGLKCLCELAEHREAEAQFALGSMYEEGEGVSKDEQEAKGWYDKAAKQGHASAQIKLASMYFAGRGGPVDKSKALMWCQKAAEKGDTEAQFALGLMYCDTEGALISKAEVIEELSLEYEPRLALTALSCDSKRDVISKAESIAWLHKAAQQWANTVASPSLKGPCPLPNALHWLERIASLGDAQAQCAAGSVNLTSFGAETEALAWFRKSAEQGHPAGQHYLGEMYAQGKGVPKDETEAYKWNLLAGAQGNEEAREKCVILETVLTKAQRAAGQRLAREFKPTTASSEQER